jgi:hypothetical protein
MPCLLLPRFAVCGCLGCTRGKSVLFSARLLSAGLSFKLEYSVLVMLDSRKGEAVLPYAVYVPHMGLGLGFSRVCIQLCGTR